MGYGYVSSRLVLSGTVYRSHLSQPAALRSDMQRAPQAVPPCRAPHELVKTRPRMATKPDSINRALLRTPPNKLVINSAAILWSRLAAEKSIRDWDKAGLLGPAVLQLTRLVLHVVVVQNLRVPNQHMSAACTLNIKNQAPIHHDLPCVNG